MKLRDKARFFHDLSQLVRSGISLPAAFEMLLAHSGLGSRAALERIRASLTEGNSVTDSLSVAPNVFGNLEIGVISAAERSGRLDDAFKTLSDYFEEQANAQTRIWAKLTYPLFIIHAGVIILNVPEAVKTGDWGSYFMGLAKLLVVCWGGLFLGTAVVSYLLKMACDSLVLDRIFMNLPLVGQIRRNFALSRFFGTYNMQLDSGANVITCLESAALASSSASIRVLIRKITPAVSSGGQVGPLLGSSSLFPPAAVQTIMVGEQTGRLDDQLKRLSKGCLESAISRLEKVTEWTPKIIYLVVLLFMGWRVVTMWGGYFKAIEEASK